MPGHRPDLLVRVTADPLDPSEALGFVADPGAGGTVLFSGTVRDHSDAGDVTGLDYEAWEDRAGDLLDAIGDDLFAAWPVRKVALLHRVGGLSVGEISVWCAVRPHIRPRPSRRRATASSASRRTCPSGRRRVSSRARRTG
jgi:molybdopterin synthase catalytic subunit